MEDSVRFELTEPLRGSLVFKTSALGHSANYPESRDRETRTPNLLVPNQAPCHWAISRQKVVLEEGFEPSESRS